MNPTDDVRPDAGTVPVGPLHGLRVLEVSRRFGYYCGKLLADLGAEVVLVEPPERGVPLRAVPPFVDDRPDLESSIAHVYLNTSKRSVRLDLDDPAGRAAFARLAADADLILEDEPPGAMAARGLGPDALAAANPRLVVASITPYGQSGPAAGDAATDLTLLASGGLLGLMGYPDEPPTQAAGEQAIAMACMYGSVAVAIALLEAQCRGRGQHVDISVQECVVMSMENAAQLYDLEGKVRERAGTGQRYAGTGIFECVDGHVYIFSGGMAAARFWGNLVQWMADERVPGAEALQGPEWRDPRNVDSETNKTIFERLFGGFARGFTKDALYREAQRRRVPLCPVSTPADIAASRQLAARGFFVDAPHAPSGRTIRMPGAPYRLSATPWALQRPAPLLGADDAVLERGWAALDDRTRPAAATRVAGLRTRRASAGGRGPLAGLRVADFTWIGAGAYTTKLLADFGAEVIKVESATRMDPLRSTAPFKDGIAGINRSGYFADRNSSKRAIRLDLKQPDGVRLARALIESSDIVANNFTPGTMDRLGLGYDAVSASRPDIVYLSMSMQGATGPERDYVGFGLTIAALTGLQYLSGPPDRPPLGTGTNYPDHVPNPTHGAFALLAALHHRERTGQGQFIDLAQTEPTIALLGRSIVDWTVNGRVGQRVGNAHPSAAPHGTYPCRAARWIAVAVEDERGWRAFAARTGLDPAAWPDAATRRARRVELDAAIGRATLTLDARELAAALQSDGVPAALVANVAELVEHDPQLAHRGHWVRLAHAEMGETLYNAPPFRLSRTGFEMHRAAPLLGEHTDVVCRELLGLDDDELRRLHAAGVFD